MAIRTPPLWLQNASHPAENDRLGTQALVGAQGVRLATDLAVSATTGMVVSVSAGWGFVAGTSTSTQGMYQTYNDGAVLLTVTTASSVNPRIDRVVLTINDTSYGGATDNAVLQIIAGTPAASPVAPTTPANSLSLATIAVGQSVTSIVGGNITDTRVRAAAQDWVFKASGALTTPLAIQNNAGTQVASIDYLGGITGSSINGGQFAGVRNALINGAFGVDQRNSGATQTFTAAAALAYSVDRWYGYCTGANITGARIAGTAPDQFNYRFTGAASNTAVGFGQRIETANSYYLAGQTATLSVSLASTSLTSITWTAYYANTTDTFGTLASPTRTSIATGSFTITSTLTRYSTNIAIPAAATTGIEIVFTGGALLAAQTLTFAAAQLELGSIATPLERRPLGMELTLCQRYFQRIPEPSLKGVFNATTSANRLACPLVTQMRIPPLTSAGGSLTINGTLSLYDGTTSGTITAFTNNYSTTQGIEIDCTVATGTYVVGRPASTYKSVPQSTTNYLDASAEL